MCKNAYEQLSKRTGKIMVFCRLRDDCKEYTSEMMKLCVAQKFCSDKDKYVPHGQEQMCKYYK